MIHLHRSEKKALIIVCLLTTLIVGGCYWWFYCRPPKPAEPQMLTREEWQLIEQLEQKGRKGETKQETRLFPFDPNHADSLTLLEVGLKSWQVRNLLKYRRRGGRWRSADDFRRLYGLTDEEYARLKPYIRIAPEDAVTRSPRNERERWNREEKEGTNELTEPTRAWVEKFVKDTVLAINEVDTTLLKRIPGIGSYYARKIVRYRESLGGFINLSQIEEIEGLPAGISRWFSLAPDAVPRRRHLNRCTFKELVRHPYLNYEQVKDIFNHKRHYGPIRSWDDLRLFPNFTEADFERLKPYFILEGEAEK